MLSIRRLIIISLICLCLIFSAFAQENFTEEEILPDGIGSEDNPAEEDVQNDLSEEENASEETKDNNTTIVEEEIYDNTTQEVEKNSTEDLSENTTIPEENFTQEPSETPLPDAEYDQTLLSAIIDIFVEKLSFIKGEIVNIKAELSYDNDSPVSDKPIDFFVDEERIGTENTDDSGLASIDWDTSDVNPGVYLVGVDLRKTDLKQVLILLR